MSLYNKTVEFFSCGFFLLFQFRGNLAFLDFFHNRFITLMTVMPTPVYEEILLARLLLPFFSSGIRCKHLIETFASTTFSCSNRDRSRLLQRTVNWVSTCHRYHVSFPAFFWHEFFALLCSICWRRTNLEHLMVKWSACSPSTPMMEAQIPLNATVFIF